MKRIISVLVLISMIFSQNSIMAYAMSNDNDNVQIDEVSLTTAVAPKKTYVPNTQAYTTEDGSKHTIYWAQGITPPKMTNDSSLQGTSGYFEKEEIRTSTGTHIWYQYPYEAGNGYYDMNKNVHRMDIESHLCYLGSSVNLIYWWLEQNSDYVNEYVSRLKNTDIYNQPSGLRKILPFDQSFWDDILAQPPITNVPEEGWAQEITTSKLVQRLMGYYLGRDKGFYVDCVIDYFINGYLASNSTDGSYANTPEEYEMDSLGGLFYPIFDKQMITQRYQDTRGAQYQFYNENMKKFFNEGKGVSIAYHVGSNLAHAITIWGAEYDDNDNLVRFYVTDSDDYQYPSNMKPDTLRGMHSMNVYPSESGSMLMGNNVSDQTQGSRVFYVTTVDLAQDKWEEVLNDPSKPQDAKITSQPNDELYPMSAQPRLTKVVAQPTDRSYITYQWYECDINGNNSKKLNGQTTDTLIPDISKEGTKYYYCDVITNKNGHQNAVKTRVSKITVDSSIELTNALAPGYNFNTYTQICDVGDNILLSTNAWSKDNGTLSFQWYECDDSSGRNSRKLSGQNQASLKVSTSKSIKRFYYCEITNTNNNATGTRFVTKKTGVKCIIVDASDRTVANAIVNMIKLVDPNDYSRESYQNLQNYYKAYERDLKRGNTQAAVDLATSELIMAYESLVPYLNLELSYENEGTVNIKYDNKNTQQKNNSVLFGSNVTLNVNVNNGYEFVGWYETVTKRILSTNSSYTFAMTSNFNIQPLFKKSGTASLIFTNRTGQYVETVNKSTSEWSQFAQLDSLLPKVPFSYGYTNGRWAYDNQQVIAQLKNGKDVVIIPEYDVAQIELPNVPTPNGVNPNIELHYNYDAKSKVGSFILAAGIPKNCKVVSSGVLFSLGDRETFDPTSVILNQNNKMLVSQFTDSYQEALNVVNLLRLDVRHNVAAKGYLVYYDNTGSLKTVYTNQVNIINCKPV